jgi:SAM-dependent methyltransferase
LTTAGAAEILPPFQALAELAMSFVSDSHWRKWGAIDPYFGVVSFPEFKSDRIEENIESFFETGRREIQTVLAEIARRYGETPRKRALDFGSGVGRLVLPLAAQFREVVGVDISEAMIAEARRNCVRADVDNVDFALSDDSLSAVSGRFDLVHSYIVLQHIPVGRGLAMTERMLDLLEPGGVAVLHYSLQRTLSPVRAMTYALKHHVPLGRNLMNLLQGKPWDLPAMQMNNYPLARIIAAFERHGLADIAVIPEWHSTALTARIYGRKIAG